MLGLCRSLLESKQITRKLPASSTLTWGVSTSRHLKTGHDEQAVNLYHQMQQIRVKPTASAFVEVLKSCASTAALEQGNLIHADIIETGFGSNLFVSNTLINLYVKCISLNDARSVFDKMSSRDVVTWNAMIAGYAKDGHGHIAFHLFWQMQIEGLQPDKFTFVSMLKACWSIESLGQGKLVHALILTGHFELDVYVGSTLVHMYVSCQSLVEACEVFYNLPNRNVVTWNTMIAGFTEHGQGKEAIQTFEQMQYNSIQPNDVTFISILKAISSIDALQNGNLTHAFIIESNFEHNVMIGTTLIDMYSKCGSLADAREVFKKLSKGNVVTWSTMLAGYVDHGQNIEALLLFEEMQNCGSVSNDVMYVGLLKACSKLAAIHHGKLIHSLIIELGSPLEDFVGGALIRMYVKCGSIEDACCVFNKLLKQTVVTWSTIIEGYAEHGYGGIAIELFQKMLQEGEKPNSVTFLGVLKACSDIQASNQGKIFHMQAVESGCGSDLFVGNTLIDMYAKCGSITKAFEVFNELSKHSVSTWNAIISGCVHHGDGQEALRLFQSMQAEGVEPNNVTFACILKACCSISALEEGKLIHTNILNHEGETDIFVQSALIDLYAKHGCLDDAHKLFNHLSKRDLVPCNAIIRGYVQHGHCQEALGLFLKIKGEGIKPDSVTFVGLLQACSVMTALVQGKLIHTHIMKSAFASSLFIGNALIDMYAKSGSVKDARKVFDELANRDIISWSAMIAGFARHNDYKMAFQYFKSMQQEGLKPNDVTFVSLLSACSHMGLVNQAFYHMESMREVHGIIPAIDHYNTMVDVLGRAGCLIEAKDLIQTIPCGTNIVGWASLLSHCNTHGNIKLGKHSFDHFVTFDSRHASGYMHMAIIFMHAGMWGDVGKMDASRKNAGAWKKPGKALVEVDNKVHSFSAGNMNHEQSIEIQAKLTRLRFQMKLVGYVSHLKLVLRPAIDQSIGDVFLNEDHNLVMSFETCTDEQFPSAEECSSIYTSSKMLDGFKKTDCHNCILIGDNLNQGNCS